MLIVSGKLYLKSGATKKFLASSSDAVALPQSPQVAVISWWQQTPWSQIGLTSTKSGSQKKRYSSFVAAARITICRQPLSAQTSSVMSYLAPVQPSFSPDKPLRPTPHPLTQGARG